MTDLLAGVVQLKLDTYTTSNPQVQAGKLRMLGIASSRRSRLMPEVPTIAEMGLEGYEGMLWNAIMAPAGTPQAIIDRLAAASAKAARARHHREVTARGRRSGRRHAGRPRHPDRASFGNGASSPRPPTSNCNERRQRAGVGEGIASNLRADIIRSDDAKKRIPH
jgi:hypothetical protein